jgi:hypothetical protein
MAAASPAPAAAAAGEAVSEGVEAKVADFIRLDDEMKRAKKQLKEVRAVIDGHKQDIIEYMVSSGVDRLSGIKGGTQYIDCTQKTLKKRPTSEQMIECLAAMLAANKGASPADIIEALQNCGGTYLEHRLSRRTRRVSAAALAVAVAGGVTKKKRQHGKRKVAKVTPKE